MSCYVTVLYAYIISIVYDLFSS